MSNKILTNLKFLFKLIKESEFKFIWKGFTKRLKSEDIAFCLKRDLNIEHSKPRVLVKISIRPSQEEDEEFFIMDNSNSGLINSFPHCFVAVTDKGIPCFRLWIIDSSQNKKITETWGDTFPNLKSNEVYLESAFTIPKFRGMGIQADAVAQIADKAKDFGADYALTFTSNTNINSLRSLAYAGFEPFGVRREKWFLFKKSVSFGEISSDLNEFYKKITRRLPKK